METLCIILTKAPYATVDAAEAVRHAMGGAVEEISVKLILAGGGVNAARASQDTSETPYESLMSGISDCIDLGVEVYADSSSMQRSGIREEDLIEAVQALPGDSIAGLVLNADQTMVF